MLKKTTALISVLLSSFLSGCGIHHFLDNRDADFVAKSYAATDDLQEKIRYKIPKNSLIVVSTLLNVDNLNQTSSFGRIISDQIASAFSNLGYQVMGMEMPIDLFIMKEGGRFHLSDETKAMLRHYHASTLVGGVYAPGKHTGYVSLRMVDISSKNIIATTDFSVPMGPDAKMMMKPKDLHTALVRSANLATQNGMSVEGAMQSESDNTPMLEEALQPNLEQNSIPLEDNQPNTKQH